jgi:hypothetical protein
MRATTIILALVVTTGLAQPIERPASFDSKGKLTELSSDVCRRAGVFSDLAGFDRVQLLQADSAFVLDVYYADGTRQRRDLAAADVADVRQRVDAYLAGLIPKVNQEGRGSFLLQQIPLGMIGYGVAVTGVVQPRGAWVGGLYLISSSACYFAPMYALRHTEMTMAEAHLSVAYGYRGVLTGVDLCFVADVTSFRGFCAVTLPVGVAGQFVGYHMARGLTLGQATLVSTYTDFGIVDGLAVGGVLRLLSNIDSDGRIVLAGGLAGEAAGAYWGKRRARGWDCTEGQVIVDRTGGILGMAVPVALYAAITDFEFDSRGSGTAALLLGVAGNVGGMYVTERWVREMRLSSGSGYLVAGSTLAGALFGGGLGYLTDSPRMVVATAAVGGVGGFMGGLALARSLQPELQGHSEVRDSRFEVNYAALTGAVTSYACSREFSAPNLITVRF